jgi:aquaporin Z
MAARSYLAELVGTFLFLTIGYLSVPAFAAASAPTPNLLVVPFSFGLGLLAAIFAVGHISGGHFNPAVTIAMVLDRRTPPMDAIGYIIAQVIGAIAAGVVVLLTINQAAVTAGVTKPGAGVSDISALIIEIIATAGFLLVILASTRRASALAALAIPLSLVAFHFGVATLSGASLNPARSIGSALVGGDIGALWIYLVGPVIGGIVGWGVWRVLDGGDVITAPAQEPSGEVEVAVG